MCYGSLVLSSRRRNTFCKRGSEISVAAPIQKASTKLTAWSQKSHSQNGPSGILMREMLTGTAVEV